MDAEALFKAVCEAIPEAMQRHHVPGVAFGLLAEGHEFTAGFGVTNARHPLPVHDNTLFQIGSITKTYTGTAIVRLAEMGKLGLDEPARRYIPDFRMRDTEVTARLTARHLLTHTGGWEGDFFEDTGLGDDALRAYVEKMAELPQLTPLGKVWSYHNSGFSLAGRLIEAVTGETYEAALSELVLAPLGLRHTHIFPNDVMTHRFVAGHAWYNDQHIVLPEWALPRAAWPAGGLIASVKDQLRYARFNLDDGRSMDGTPLITAESLATMQSPTTPTQFDQHIGLAWFVFDSSGVRQIGHGGGTVGQISTLTLIPDQKLAFSWLTNSGAGGLVINDVTKEALTEYYLGPDDDDAKHIGMTLRQLQEFAGRYVSVLNDYELKLDQDHLALHTFPKGGFPKKNSPAGPPPPPTKVAFLGRDRIIALDPPLKDWQAEFLRDDSGTIAWLRCGRIYKRL